MTSKSHERDGERRRSAGVGGCHRLGGGWVVVVVRVGWRGRRSSVVKKRVVWGKWLWLGWRRGIIAWQVASRKYG